MPLHNNLQKMICTKAIFVKYQNDLKNIPSYYLKKFSFLLNHNLSIEKKEILLKKHLAEISYDFLQTEDENFEERFILKTKNGIWKNTAKLFYWAIFYGEKISLKKDPIPKAPADRFLYYYSDNGKVSSKKLILTRGLDLFCGFISKSKNIDAKYNIGMYCFDFQKSTKKIKTCTGEEFYFHVAKTPILLLCIPYRRVEIVFSVLPLEEVFTVYFFKCANFLVRKKIIQSEHLYQDLDNFIYSDGCLAMKKQ
jgi:hypothetical protein